ncbi:beta family protein [Streptomyces beijiangensis]|nr:hypothetical protein [Streptomyces beijiangensis]
MARSIFQCPPWGLMRYTTPDGFLVTKALTRGPFRSDQVRAAAGRITGSGSYRGPDFSEGEHWLHKCANGFGPEGTGNAESWLKAGHTQHLAFIVHQLRMNSGLLA